MSDETMKITLQRVAPAGSRRSGFVQTYTLDDVSPHMSFLEMLDVLNERLLAKGEDPVAFDHDCREGICGACSLVIDGQPHGPRRGTTTCQLHMRSFKLGDTITIEPWRAAAFPVLKDLMVDRRLRPRHRLRRLHLGATPAALRTPTPCRSARRAPTRRLTRPPASAAAPASPPAPTPPRCSSSAPRSPTSPSCPKGQSKPAAAVHPRDGQRRGVGIRPPRRAPGLVPTQKSRPARQRDPRAALFVAPVYVPVRLLCTAAGG
jgi:hypothetical protein